MPFAIFSAKLSGNPDTSGWVQAYEFKPQDEEKFRKRGQLFAIVCAKEASSGLSSVVEGREILARLHEEYFGNLKERTYDALKKAVGKVAQEFWENVEIASLVILDNVVYLACAGGAGILIFRNSQINTLLQSRSETLSASGFAKIDDEFILATSAFLRQFSFGVLKGSMLGKVPKESVEILAPSLHMQENAGSMGVMLVKLETTEEQQAFVSPIDSYSKSVQAVVSRVASKSLSQGAKFKFFEKLRSIRIKKIKEDEATRSPKKRLSISVGILLLVILSVSIFFGVKRKKEVDFKARYTERLASARHSVSEAQSLYGLSPERARELLLSARTQVLGLQSENISDPELEDLIGQIKIYEREILGEYREESKLFSDLGLVSEGFRADELTSTSDNIFILDRQGKKIMKVSIKTGRSEIIAGPLQIDNPRSLAAYLEKVYYWNEDGVVEITSGKRVIDADWLGDTIGANYGGNLYILDKGASTIYKYTLVDSRFSSKSQWLREGVNLDLTQSSQMVIDGTIWLLSGDEILNFSLGNPKPFSLSGVLPEVENPVSIFTNEEQESLYILEPAKERVVVVSKEGDYVAQYLSGQIREAKRLVASEQEKKLILLSQDKLLFIELKHLER